MQSWKSWSWYIFFQNGLTDPHPIIGALMIPSIESGIQKAFMFIRRLPLKMHVHIGATGLHKVVALLIIVYLNLSHSPGHKLLSMLIEYSKEIPWSMYSITVIRFMCYSFYYWMMKDLFLFFRFNLVSCTKRFKQCTETDEIKQRYFIYLNYIIFFFR